MKLTKIKVENTYSKIENLNDLHVIDAISQALTYRLNAARYTWQFRSGMWDGSTRLLTKNLRFPTGCLDTVISVLNKKHVVYDIVDKRTWVQPSSTGLTWQGFDLYEYQNRIVDIALDKKCGMVKVATGGGKSIILSRLVYEYNVPSVIYVVSLDLLSQMHETLEKCLGVPIGIIGGGKCEIQKFNVCSAWTAGNVFTKSRKKKKEDLEEDVKADKWKPNDQQKIKIREMIEGAQLVVLDESQFAAASSIQSILQNSKSAAHKYGFSGTPWRSGGDDLLLEAAFGPNICDIKASELIDLGYLVTPKIAFRDVPAYEYKLKKNWSEVKSNYIIENEVRNDMLIRNVVRLLDLGRKPLILFRERKHGRILEEMLPSDLRYRYVTGEVSKAERDEIRNEFKQGNIDLILASTVYDQGVDLPGLDALILASGGKSTAKALQRIGRVIRGNPDGGKTDALVVETFDQAHFVQSHSIVRHGAYSTEPRFKIKMGSEMAKYVKRYVR